MSAEGDSTELSATDVAVRFGGLQALDEVDFAVRAGERVGLIGPNGSGKSTFLNVLSGIQTPTRGTVRFRGQDITRMPAHQRARLGIMRTFQDLKLFERLSVADHVRVGTENGSRSREQPDPLLDRLSLADSVRQLPETLPFGLRRSVEIARSIAGRPSLLLLDEPAAGLNDAEKRRLGEVLAGLTDGGAMSLVLVEHNIRLVMDVCTRVVVLNQGRVLATGSPEEVRANPDVIATYLGVARD